MHVQFERPEFLWILAILPVLWWMAFRYVRSLGKFRTSMAVLLRSFAVIAIACALSGIQFARSTDRVTVVYVVDQSDSIDAETRSELLSYVVQSVRRHRNSQREDLAGVILFGKDAAIEVPPFADDVPLLSPVARDRLRTDATDLEGAINLAQASMPSDTLHRIVVVTDGNQTAGQVRLAAIRAADSGIGIDVVPVGTKSGADVWVERIDLPTEVRSGQPFDSRVVASYHPTEADAAPVQGRLNVTRKGLGETVLVIDEAVELQPGKNVFPLDQQIDRPAGYTFEAEFIPLSQTDDVRRDNNRAEAFAVVRGKSRVLLIEPWGESGAWDSLAEQLRKEKIDVVVQPSNATFTSLAELQAYDSVILANVARTSGDSAETISSISDAQIEMLVRNTQQLGAGLLMIGGPDAFGAGGWIGTPLEEAMPVDFEIDNTKVNAVGALMLVMDSSGSMSGEKIQLCKAAARAAITSLSPTDYVGVITFDSTTREVIPLQRIGQRTHMFPLISRIAAGGGTDMFPAMSKGHRELVRNDAAVKHLIVLTDGQTTPNNFRALTQRMRNAGITVTGVAIGADADLRLMREIATAGGGKLYRVLSPQAIPKIILRESRRVSRPMVFEDQRGIEPRVEMSHVVLDVDGPPPPITGYVLTTPKENPLVQTLISAPVPSGRENPILAVWQYGLGRTAVLTTDGGQRWADQWVASPSYQKLYPQLLRWLMRPTSQSDNFQMTTQLGDGEIQVVVDALSDEQGFLDFLEIQSSVLDPEMGSIPLRLKQTAPGRYAGSFPVDRAGSYLVNVVPEAGVAPLIAGVTVPFGSEYRARETNWPLIRQVASTQPSDGQAGDVAVPVEEGLEKSLASNPFRGGLANRFSIRDAWPWLVMIGCYFFLSDVTVRRIQFDFSRFVPGGRRKEGERAGDEMARLRSLHTAKQQTGRERERSRRLQPLQGDVSSDSVSSLESQFADPPQLAEKSKETKERDESSGEAASTSYTQRLLEAKHRAGRSS